jgi:galactose-1-phosphate uridylyltransferase
MKKIIGHSHVPLAMRDMLPKSAKRSLALKRTWKEMRAEEILADINKALIETRMRTNDSRNRVVRFRSYGPPFHFFLRTEVPR